MALDGMGGQRHAPAYLPPRKNQYPLYKSLGGPEGRSGRVRKFSPPLGFDPRTVQTLYSSLCSATTCSKVLACSTTFFHRSVSCATFLQLRRFILFISSKTSSSQRSLVLPLGLLDMGCHLLICTLFVQTLAMRYTD
jgi:hypothetical protein